MGKVKYEDLPDTIGVLDYMNWRGCGRSTADERFHSKDFPLIKVKGSKLMADKRAVFIAELGLSQAEKEKLLTALAEKII